ncbi:hypothetical protein HOLleu_41646 [Holothuria leucospilota]|uniref:Uncharacterized protein n=1 Tax=Holothuria leucospilota TaxID=206669 RepID=A0A9Q0YEF4_HOLLE|nr:hypothetical protein HOLleu_41646 [Holothuria leucospilota]
MLKRSNMTSELGIRQVRMVYLITYSQADSNVCGSRKDFASKVLMSISVLRNEGYALGMQQGKPSGWGTSLSHVRQVRPGETLVKGEANAGCRA